MDNYGELKSINEISSFEPFRSDQTEAHLRSETDNRVV